MKFMFPVLKVLDASGNFLLGEINYNFIGLIIVSLLSGFDMFEQT